MDRKNILGIIGAGLTGGYLALKFRKPKKSYSEFLTCYWALSIDVLRELETCFVETMLPELPPSHSPEFTKLLDGNVEFLDKMKFFQDHLENFNELALSAINRFYSEKAAGNLAVLSHRKIPGLDINTVSVAVQEAFRDLESAFSYAIMANAPEDSRAQLKEKLGTTGSLPEILKYYSDSLPHFGAVVFDAFAQFESQIMRGHE